MITLRLILTSIALCGFLYTASVYGFARMTNLEQASGSLVRNPNGQIIGSRLIGQSFTSDRYLHTRPSACDYNASAAAGSNLSPTNPKLSRRASAIITYHQASTENPIPADLVTASGSGLDPDITESAARYQVSRIAKARQLDPAMLIKAIDDTKRPLMGKLDGTSLINVLEVNLALDRIAR